MVQHLRLCGVALALILFVFVFQLLAGAQHRTLPWEGDGPHAPSLTTPAPPAPPAPPALRPAAGEQSLCYNASLEFATEARTPLLRQICVDGPGACDWNGFDGGSLNLASLVMPALGYHRFVDSAATAALFTANETDGSRLCRDAELTAAELRGAAAADIAEARGPMGSAFVAPRRCLAGSRILFTGNSNTRYVAAMMCMMVNGTQCEPFGWQYPNVSTVVAGDASLTYLRSNYDVRDKLLFLLSDPGPPNESPEATEAELSFLAANSDLQGFWPMRGEADRLSEAPGERRELSERLVRRLRQNPAVKDYTHVVLSRGPWDFLFTETPPRLLADQIRESLLLVSEAMPNARIIYQLPFFHWAAQQIGGKKKKKWNTLRWRNTCLSPQRQMAMRNALVCGIHEAVRNATAADRSLRSRLSLFDQYDVTRRLPGLAVYRDRIGAHYLDVALEWMAQRLMADSVCPSERHAPPHADHLAFLDRWGPQSCRDVLPRLTRIPGCDCQLPVHLVADKALCAQLSRSIPKRGN